MPNLSAIGCWHLFIIVTTRVIALQAVVPPPVLTKAGPSAPQVSQGRLLVTTCRGNMKITSETQGQAFKGEDWKSIKQVEHTAD